MTAATAAQRRTRPAAAPRAADAEFAHAKVNLALHVVGRRADGYHELDTLVCFPPVGDEVAVAAEDISFAVDGPFAHHVPAGPENLAYAAAAHLAALHPGEGRAIALRLVKRLPVAAGIGGGSADAAAVLRLLARRWGLPLTAEALVEIARPLGADVPMCVRSRPARARGIGDALAAVPPLPAAGIVLANPGVPVATPAVFAALERRDNAPLPMLPAAWPDARALAEWLILCRNDLEPAARRVAPVIDHVLATLAALPGALVARLSGSGATAFALFDTPAEAELAARRLRRAEPLWWVAASSLDAV